MKGWNQKMRSVPHGIISLMIAAWFSCCLTVSMPGEPPVVNLQAGVAQVDITPPPGLPMYGYFDRLTKHQVSTGTIDPLYARVLVFEAVGKRVALVTLDLGRTFDDSWLDRLRTAAKQVSRIDEVVVTASHTHSGPNILDVYPEGHPPAWQDETLHKVLDAIHQAASHVEPVRLGIGHGDAQIGYNRRRVNPDNSVTMLWSNPEKKPTAPVDTTVNVIRIDRLNGTPLVILVNYACHPVVFGADNLQYSADYVATMVETVTSAFPSKPICLFLQGADGDINPYDATTPMDQGAIQKRDWTGREIGQAVAQIAKQIQTRTTPDSLDFADDVLFFAWRWDPQKFHDDLLRVNGPLVFQDHAGPLEASALPSKLALHVTSVLISKQIALVGMPGEPFVDFQINLRDRCPVEHCLLLGYTNGYFDYFPTILAASQGGYGASDSNTYVSVGAGESMMDHALIRLYEMLGDLTPAPPLENDTRRHR
jgi:hypothetical protein